QSSRGVPLRCTSRPIVLRCRPRTRAIAAGARPPWRSRPSVYLSAKVIWRYVMAGFFLLVENRRLPSARSPFSLGTLLHLLYESAPPNKRLKLAGGDRPRLTRDPVGRCQRRDLPPHGYHTTPRIDEATPQLHQTLRS